MSEKDFTPGKGVSPARVLGVIAEYDPFHNGHARHLRLAREAVRPDFTYVVLSGCFKQRGDPALLSPRARAACALVCGADAVFALPALWTLRDAEHYALGAVSLLKDLGATHLAFGAETDRLDLLRSCAALLEDPQEGFQRALRDNLQAGLGYPRALSRAAGAVQPELSALLDAPNNTLAVCYLRAIQRLGAALHPVLIHRNGCYHADRINPEAPSASAIRGAIARGDYAHAFAAVPAPSEKLLRAAFLSGEVPSQELYSQLLLHRLRDMSADEIRALPDLSEGLEDRILAAARRAKNREELLDTVSSRRYPRARISRICAMALLNITRERLEAAPLPDRAVLLGLKRDSRMTELWKKKSKLITSEWEDPADLRAWSVWAQCAGLADTLPWTLKMAVHEGA